MTTRRVLLAIAATITVTVAATIVVERVLDDETPTRDAVTDVVRSAILGEAREFFVHLPDGYASNTAMRYPVLYVLDGTSQFGHTVESARLLARTGTIPPLIVVGVPSVNGDTRNQDYTPPGMRIDADAPSGPQGAADRFLSFMQDELVPRVDRAYRTARPRMLAGWSRGGLFVVHAAIAAPALFDARFAHSPALWRDNGAILSRLEEALESRTLAGGFLYVSLGDQENATMTAAFNQAVALLERRAPVTLRWRADRSAGGLHDSNPHLSTPTGLCAAFVVDRPCSGSGITVVGGSRAPAALPLAAAPHH